MLNRQTNQQKYIFTGTIVRLINHDPETGYAEFEVLRSKPPKRTEYVVAYLPTPYPGIKMRFLGEWGFLNGTPIFHADVAYELQPKTLTEIRKYLRSGILNGIDGQIIKNMVRYFKEETVNVLDNDTERLAEVEGVSKDLLSKIIVFWFEHKHLQVSMSYLQQHGLIGRFAVQAFKHYGGFTREKVNENPYRLLQDLEDIRFPDVDPFALYLGMSEDCDERIMAAISYLLIDCQNSGHCYLTAHQICKCINKLLDIDVSEYLHEILRDMQEQQLVKTHKLTPKGRAPQLCYYDPSVFEAELYVARKIARNDIPPEANLEWIEDLVKRYQASELYLSDEQVDAIIGSICSKYSVISGGVCTGKTSVLKAIVYILKKMALKFHLVTPTDCAAQRLSEFTGQKAQTIHRLLGYKKDKSFQYNEKNLIETDFLIIDETSLVDIRLLAALLHAAPGNAQVLFVGDSDQLPAIGPGNVLKDLIEFKAIPVYRLTQVFFENKKSMILKYASQIKSGLPVKMILSEIESAKMADNYCDCYFFFTKEAGAPQLNDKAIEHVENRRSYWWQAPDLIQSDQSPSDIEPGYSTSEFIRLLYKKLKSGVDCPEIQILTPTNQDTGPFNQKIQNTVNPYDPRSGKRQLRIGNKIFRVGDRVIHCKNNHKLGVFNGEIGTVVKVGDNGSACTVAYSGKRFVDYCHNDTREMDLAYAIPAHKSQGSEFDVVIIPISKHCSLLSRSLIYTAITRAKRLVVFVGEMSVFTKALENRFSYPKETGLKELLLL